ncbi:aromatic prenyltransferase [Astrocystis sublimbata]|nr:aromatic prenyltransferase [Astrocystis sublimbata]
MSYHKYPLVSSWNLCSKWLILENENHEWWWKTTGGHLAFLLDRGDHNLYDQINTLLFHYHLVATRLGPYPRSSTSSWASFMTDDCSPIEYSWKWGQGRGSPEIRYGIEAISSYAGTVADPLNQTATCELLFQLKRMNPAIDLTGFEYFRQFFFGTGSGTSPTAQQKRSSLFLAFEMKSGVIDAKAYFIPVESKRDTVDSSIYEAVESLGFSNRSAIQQMKEYLGSNEDAATLKPFMVGIDLTRPANSRLKVYVRSPLSSFQFVSDFMTLGRRRTGFEAEREQFADLWRLTLCLAPDYPENAGLPANRHSTAGTCFYFDLSPKDESPNVKAYIPVRHYAPSDMEAALGLTRFLDKHGRGEYTRSYLEAVKHLAKGGNADSSGGVQTYISCAYKGGTLCMTSYLSPQIYSRG